MRPIVWISILLVVVVIAGVAFWRFARPHTAVVASSSATVVVTDYRCSGGKSIKASYLPAGMKLDLSDGRSLLLKSAPAASGARYSNETGSVVFWSKQYSAFLEESGQTSFQGCVIYPLPFAK
jgi:membrane-bound inhibitor of C-type lysozyme